MSARRDGISNAPSRLCFSMGDIRLGSNSLDDRDDDDFDESFSEESETSGKGMEFFDQVDQFLGIEEYYIGGEESDEETNNDSVLSNDKQASTDNNTGAENKPINLGKPIPPTRPLSAIPDEVELVEELEEIQSEDEIDDDDDLSPDLLNALDTWDQVDEDLGIEDFLIDGSEDQVDTDPPFNPLDENRYANNAWHPVDTNVGERVGNELAEYVDSLTHELSPEGKVGDVILDFNPMLGSANFMPTETIIMNHGNTAQEKEPLQLKDLEKSTSKLSLGLKKFGKFIKTKASSLKGKLSKLGEVFSKKTSKPSLQHSPKMDRLDRQLAGRRPQLKLNSQGLLKLFSIQIPSEGFGVLPGSRSEKLAIISNELTSIMDDLRSQLADIQHQNPNKLDRFAFTDVVVKELVARAPIEQLQALSEDTIQQLSGSFSLCMQGDKADFLQAISKHAERVLNSGDDVAKVRSQMLDEVAKTRFGKEKEKLDPKSLLSGLSNGSTSEVSRLLGVALDAWNKEAANEDMNPFDLSPIAYRQSKLTELFQDIPASNLSEMNPEQLRSMIKEFISLGLEEKAQALSEVLQLLEMSRTPEGSDELYFDLALQGMRDAGKKEGAENFMRNTSHSDVSAVKKLMNGNGALEMESQLRTLLEPIANDPEIKALGDRLGGLRYTSPELTPELAIELGHLALRLMQVASGLTVPDGVMTLLGRMQNAIPKGEAQNLLIHRLFSDQLILKLLAPVMGKMPSQAIRTACDLINVLANGVRPHTTSKYGPEGKKAMERVGKQIIDLQEAMLIRFGMKPEATVPWN